VRGLDPPPDAVAGIKRSGLFPAVFLSQQLDLPMFAGREVEAFPYPRLRVPLIVDTCAWSGGSIRRMAGKLERRCPEPSYKLVMYARAEPFPVVEGLLYLHTARHIPRFWYDEPLPGAGEKHGP
jgi:hypothetical protein